MDRLRMLSQGFFYGEFGLAQERRLSCDPSTPIPLLVRYPSLVKAGATPDALVSNVDLAPSCSSWEGRCRRTWMENRWCPC